MLKKKSINLILNIVLIISYFIVFVLSDYGKINHLSKVFADYTTDITEDILYGDINFDGKISIADIILLAKSISKKIKLTDKQLKCADVSDDIAVNAEDLLCLIKYLTGEIKEFPAKKVSNLEKLNKIANETFNKDIPNAIIGFDFGDTPLFFESSELFNKNITLYFKVSNYTKNAYSDLEDYVDLGIISKNQIKGNSNSIFNYPNEIGIYPVTYKTSVTPILKIGNTEYIGNDIPLDNTIHSMTIAIGQDNKEPVFYDIEYTAGEMFSIVLDFGVMSAQELALSYTDYINSTEGINNSQNLLDLTDSTLLDEKNIYSAEYLGRLLRFIGCYYFTQLDSTSAQLANQINITEKSCIKVGRFGYKTQLNNSYIQKYGYYYCDVFGDCIDLISNDGNEENLKLFAAERSSIGSGLEHVVIEEVTGIDAISTVKIIEEAKEQNIEILTLYKGSEKTINNLPFDSYLKNTLNQYIQEGKVITIPVDEISLGDWTGIGYIVTSNKGTSSNEIYGNLTGNAITNGGFGTAYTTLLYGIYLTLNTSFMALAIVGFCAALPWSAIGGTLALGLSIYGILQQQYNVNKLALTGDADYLEALWMAVAIESLFVVGTMGIDKLVTSIEAYTSRAKYAATDGEGAAANVIKNAGDSADDAIIIAEKYGKGFTDSLDIISKKSQSEAENYVDDVEKIIRQLQRENAIADLEKFKKAWSAPKNSRPDPSIYLTKDYIDKHLTPFNDGVTKIMAGIDETLPLGKTETFVIPKSTADTILTECGDDIARIEIKLGLTGGYLGDNPVRVDVPNPQNIRIPSGNEVGANEYWIPGGYTSGRLPEAVIDSVPAGNYIKTNIK